MIKDNVKKFREAKGYSKTGLARMTGLSARCIEHIEYGIALNPKIETLQKIAKVLGVTVDDLIK